MANLHKKSGAAGIGGSLYLSLRDEKSKQSEEDELRLLSTRLKTFLACSANSISSVVESFLDSLALSLELTLSLELGVDPYLSCISWVSKVWDAGGHCPFFGHPIDWLEVKEGV